MIDHGYVNTDVFRIVKWMCDWSEHLCPDRFCPAIYVYRTALFSLRFTKTRESQKSVRTQKISFHYKFHPCMHMALCHEYSIWLFDFCRFDGLGFLRRFQGKSIMFVGDSLSRDQWQSLTCLLYTAAPNLHYNLTRVGMISTFTIMVCCPHFNLLIASSFPFS